MKKLEDYNNDKNYWWWRKINKTTEAGRKTETVRTKAADTTPTAGNYTNTYDINFWQLSFKHRPNFNLQTT
jgi:hypothetical protein